MVCISHESAKLLHSRLGYHKVSQLLWPSIICMRTVVSATLRQLASNLCFLCQWPGCVTHNNRQPLHTAVLLGLEICGLFAWLVSFFFSWGKLGKMCYYLHWLIIKYVLLEAELLDLPNFTLFCTLIVKQSCNTERCGNKLHQIVANMMLSHYYLQLIN